MIYLYIGIIFSSYRTFVKYGIKTLQQIYLELQSKYRVEYRDLLT